MSAPTEKQYRYLLMLGGGAALVCGTKRQTEMYLRRGWVTARPTPDSSYPYSFVRITPDGLRALALAVEQYGLPEFEKRGTPAAVTAEDVSTAEGTRRSFV